MGFTVVDVKRPILSVSRLMDRGIETFIQAGKQFLRRFDGATVYLTRRGGLFVLQCQAVVPSVNWWDEKKWNHQLRSKFRHPMSQPVTSGDIMDSHTCRINFGATSVSELARERKQTCVTATKPARHTRHPMRLLLPEDTGTCLNGHSPGGHRTQCTNKWLPFLLRRKETEIRLQLTVYPHSHDTSDIPKRSSKETWSTRSRKSSTTHVHC